MAEGIQPGTNHQETAVESIISLHPVSHAVRTRDNPVYHGVLANNYDVSPESGSVILGSAEKTV